MLIEEHKPLKSFNTFGIDCKARYFVSIDSVLQLKKVLSQEIHPTLFVLGAGSNVLLTGDVNALVVHINLKGISIVSETDTSIRLQIMAGENWHEFVRYCIAKEYGGIENLSLIPGNVGTAPIQNIGAYGVELNDVFISCAAIEIDTLKENTFDRSACEFEYRNSIFKNKAKGKYIITSVILELTKTNHKISASYGAIQEKLAENHIENPSINDISNAVIAIRQSKLPDPSQLGNSGSFFKNPVLDVEAFKRFRSEHPTAPFYEVSVTQFKIPAAWLIEKAGFKGQRSGDAGVHKLQALVLVNYGSATGSEIWELALRIQKKVKEDFGIFIEPEVNVI
ncbi:MAG: UDP-N-acetylenolpyruvoylglucosamine reductase [Bacteroidetes bacterium]|nr:MAG: UDP-N-acetylenolpyruvoylglucosamine reductase [Bacteroidota bacterium]